jgi:hypothetical protein
MLACSPRSAWDFVQLNYTVSCADQEKEELVHRYWGSGFTITIDTSGAVFERQAEETRFLFRMNPNGLIYREEKVDGNCATTELKGNKLDFFRNAKQADSLVVMKGKRQIGPFKAKGVLIYDENLGKQPAELWYTDEIPSYWPYTSDIPGMMLEYNYALDGKKVKYRLGEVLLPAALPEWSEPPCEWIFPEVFLVNPEVGTIDVNSYELYGYVKEELTEKSLPYSAVEIFRNDSLYYTTYTDSVGYFKVFLPLQGVYKFVLSAGNNYVPKFIELDLNVPPMVDVSGGFATEVTMMMFESEDQRVWELLQNQPIGKAAYDEPSDNFEFDFDYTAAIQEEIRLLRKEK